MNYAIIKTGGRQFRVAEGDTIDVDILDVEPGKTATFGDVLLFADGDKVTHGDPLISGAKVTAEVLEQRKDKKVIAFKYKRRKGYHRTVGHRRKLTRVKIKSINMGEKKTAPKKTEESCFPPTALIVTWFFVSPMAFKSALSLLERLFLSMSSSVTTFPFLS